MMKISRSLREKFRVIPLLMLVATLAFTVRVGDFVYGFDHMGSAVAAQESVEEVNAAPPAVSPTSAAAEKNQPAAMPSIDGRLDLDAADNAVKLKPEFEQQPAEVKFETKGEPVEWKDSNDTDIESSKVKAELYQDLAKRRDQLDKKEKEITVREALLSAAERELDQKLRELTNLKGEIETMMVKRSEEEEARITSLVKIYEGMKPKDAASIFNTLDLDVLIVIMTKMSERKSSPILAEMNAERARTITIMMAEQKKAPELPDSN